MVGADRIKPSPYMSADKGKIIVLSLLEAATNLENLSGNMEPLKVIILFASSFGKLDNPW